ncbi:unnamed protein product [Brachionus calyciflorus]|uniref:non-specific serine/threonine protein kinase n=1 Tax=Brachionus calyciflorus TaxID=104777 RepID=A0A813TUL2_9BILA|nr:unnamed protein product [Brachionus calyciflorus]
MCDLSLVVEYDHDRFIPLYCLKNDLKDKLKKEWFDTWSGFELSVSWNLYHSIGSNIFAQTLKNCFSQKKTILLWKNGLLNRECSCDILIKQHDLKITLTVRILNPKEPFNLDVSNFKDYATFVFMDYYLMIQKMFYDNNIPNFFDFDLNFKHPLFLQNGTKKLSEIIEYDRNYYGKLLSYNHVFKKGTICDECSHTSIFEYSSLNQIIEKIYPLFTRNSLEVSVSNGNIESIKKPLVLFDLNLNQSHTFSSIDFMNLANFYKFRVKFIEKEYSSTSVKLSLKFSNETACLIDLQKRTQKTYDQFKVIKLIRTKFVMTNSTEDKDEFVYPIYAGDQLTVKLQNWSSESYEISIEFNSEEICCYSVSTDIKVKPELKIDALRSRNSKEHRATFSKENVKFIILTEGLYDDEYNSFHNIYLPDQNSCLKLLDPRKKIKEITNYLEANFFEIGKSLRTLNNTDEEGRRGILLLPTNIDSCVNENLGIHHLLNNTLAVHTFCLNFNYYSQIEQSFFYSHLIDVKGIPVSLKDMSKDLILYYMISSYFLSKAQNSNLIPVNEQLFPSFKQGCNLSEKLREFASKIYKYLIIFFDLNDFQNKSITYNIRQTILDKLSSQEQSQVEYFFLTTCYFCNQMEYNSINDLKHSKRLEIKYTNSAMNYAIKGRSSELTEDSETIDLNSEFVENFPELKMLGFINLKLNFENSPNLFSKFKCLTLIQLENNQMAKLPESLFQMDTLESLDLSRNPLKNINEKLFIKLKNLKNLSLDNLSISKNDLNSKITLPMGLKKLVFSSIQFDELPFNFDQCKLSLESLKFSGIEWIDSFFYTLNGDRHIVQFDSVIYTLQNFLTLDQITKLSAYLDADKKGYLGREECIKLSAFIFKKFPRLNTISPIIFEFKNLTHLDLSYQAIKSIPDEIYDLKKLKELILKNCILLENLSSKLAELPLNLIDLTGCISVKTPPPEIIKRGTSSILSYLRRLSSGKEICKRTKLMLVGLGEAGKTSLMNSLISASNSNKPELTDGIDIKDWVVELPDKTKLTYSIWDFAGQSVYYNSHQFFLSSRAVYFLVWNVRLGSDYAGLDFWLNSINCHAPGAPIFIIGTHIDEVAKFTLNKEKLKARYNQICGFHFVSNTKNIGINELVKDLLDVTLKQKYMGESIPSVWLNFENLVKQKSASESLVSYDYLSNLASECGIFESEEILNAIRFLNDLGSIQYFERNGLKDRVVINPQWIVNVISCVVSVKNTPIHDGKLLHVEIKNVWKNYDVSLHEWIVKLTEEFDLTFSVPEKQMHIVPCLLPEEKPDFQWQNLNPTESNTLKIKEFKVLYHFEYLPIGLFNRIQVRLYQYGDSTIWKNGSLLHKNNQKALMEQTANSTIEIRVQGNKPENIVFVIHEVIEALINESFNGIKYDYSFPCPDCVEARSNDPCLFSSSLLHRANEFKAPFLQCNKYFHAISIQEMMSVMPIDGLSNLDMNLEYSLRDLKKIKTKLKYDIAFWYCDKDVQPNNPNLVNPLRVIDKISKENYKIWFTKNPKDEKLDIITYALKESKLVILGISDEFSKDLKCLEILSLVKNLLKKNYLLIEFGSIGARKWLMNPAFASLCCDYRVIMQDPKRISSKLAEMFESIDLQLQDTKIDRDVSKKPPEIFISYCWANSHEAARKGSRTTKTSLGWLDPRNLVKFFEEHNINCWIDTQQINSNGGIFGAMTKGMNTACVVIACVSDEYANSATCKLEFRFAHVSLKIPIIKVVVGTGNLWRRNEIAFLGGNYPEVNFQFENPNSYEELLSHVRKVLNSQEPKKEVKRENEIDKREADSNNSAFQELYELTQRRFLKQINKLINQNFKNYPSLFCIDFIESKKLPKDENKINNKMIFKIKQDDQEIELYTCIRPLCEHEEGWHLSNLVLVLPELLPEYCGYLLRIMNIIKNGPLSNDLQIFLLDSGHRLLADIEKKSSLSLNIGESYLQLRKFYIEEYESKNVVLLDGKDIKHDLNKCELKNGKILWLCKNHVESTNAKLIDDNTTNESSTHDPLANQILEDIKTIDISIV